MKDAKILINNNGFSIVQLFELLKTFSPYVKLTGFNGVERAINTGITNCKKIIRQSQERKNDESYIWSIEKISFNEYLSLKKPFII